METIEKNKAQMAVIKEFVYEFKSKDRLPLDLNDNSKIFLVINDNETSIAIESLFIGGIDIDEGDVTGYSILQLISGGTNLKIDENTTLKITFIDKSTGREFYISRIRRPFFYEDDMEISPESRLKYIDLLLTTSMIPVNNELEAQRVAKEATELEEKRKNDEAEAEKEAERLRIKAEKENIPGGIEWEGQRNDLIEKGFKEYPFNDYRMFYKPSEAENPAEIGFFELKPGDYEFIELYEENITDEVEEYSFDNEDGNEFNVVFNKTNDSINVWAV